MRKAYSRANMSQPEVNQLELHKLMEKWKRFPDDTGSSEVQIAIFTHRIGVLSRHLQVEHKDKDALRDMQKFVRKRNRMLAYLRRRNRAKYDEVLEELGIRKTAAFDPLLKKEARYSNFKYKVTKGRRKKRGRSTDHSN